MKKLDRLVKSFMQLSESYPDSVEILEASCRSVLEHIGFPYYACCTHIDPSQRQSGAVLLHSYPSPWVQHWFEAQLFRFDPVLMYAERCTRPFLWDDAFARHPVTEEQADVLADAAPFGLAGGYTVPIRLPWISRDRRASCSVVPDGRAIDPLTQIIVQGIARSLYVSASCALALRGVESTTWVKLDPRERVGLIRLARGNPEWSVRHLFGNRPHMADSPIKQIKQLMGVRTLEQAVFRGLKTHQIYLGEILSPFRPAIG